MEDAHVKLEDQLELAKKLGWERAVIERGKVLKFPTEARDNALGVHTFFPHYKDVRQRMKERGIDK